MLPGICTASSLLITSLSGHWLTNLLNLLAPNKWGPPATQTPANSGVPGVRVPTPCVPVSSRGIPAFAPDVLSFRRMKGILMRGWDLILPGWRLPHEPEPISNQPVVTLGFPHRARRYRPGGPPFLFPVCCSCKCMEIFVIRGWDPIIFHFLCVPLASRTRTNQQ